MRPWVKSRNQLSTLTCQIFEREKEKKQSKSSLRGKKHCSDVEKHSSTGIRRDIKINLILLLCTSHLAVVVSMVWGGRAVCICDDWSDREAVKWLLEAPDDMENVR